MRLFPLCLPRSNESFRGGRQHDAHELLKTLLDGMREEVLQSARQIKRHKLFAGELSVHSRIGLRVIVSSSSFPR